MEVSHGPTLIDNNIMLSQVSLRFATQGVAMVHNLMTGTFTKVGSGTGTRYTPYHIRHRTEVAGFMHFLHGDDRFYNNIFVQGFPKDGEIRRAIPRKTSGWWAPWCFDDLSHLWTSGSAWFDLDVGPA